MVTVTFQISFMYSAYFFPFLKTLSTWEIYVFLTNGSFRKYLNSIVILQDWKHALVLLFTIALIVDDDVCSLIFLLFFFVVYVAVGSAVSLETIDWEKHIRLEVNGLPTHTRHMLLVVCQVGLAPQGFGSSWVCLSWCWVHSSSRLYYHPQWIRNAFASVPPCLDWWLDCWWCLNTLHEKPFVHWLWY